MAVGPAQPASPKQPHGDRPPPPEHDEATPEPASDERFGPLTITRVQKDDGRALILYGHDEEPPSQTADASVTEPDDGREQA
jgi:hypothetical protein